MEHRVVVLDGYSLLFRAFHALPLMDNGEGETAKPPSEPAASEPAGEADREA